MDKSLTINALERLYRKSREKANDSMNDVIDQMEFRIRDLRQTMKEEESRQKEIIDLIAQKHE